jgi:hypothetical protein
VIDVRENRPADDVRVVHGAGDVAGPTTQELALYETRESLTSPVPPVPPVPPFVGPSVRPPVPRTFTPGASPGPSPSASNRLARWDDLVGSRSHGERVRESVERWSRWASGLGLPARDGRGYERYARADRRLVPPAVWIAVALGLAGVVGLLTGVLVSSPSSSGAARAAGLPTPATVTVTRQVQQAPVTETATRTTTKTVTATMAAPNPATVPGVTLGPGSSGPQVVRLQEDLASLGVYAAQPTGAYDGPTIVAVQAFQSQQGVVGDPPGVAGQATLMAIDHALGR